MPLEVRQFNCPQCGSPLDLKNARSKSVICPSCSSQIDLTGPQGQVVGRVGSRPTPRMTPFQPGMTGTLNGEQHMIIGRVLYRSDEGDEWDEWLLLSASGQYRWISDSEEEGMALWEPFVPTAPIDPNTIQEGRSINLRGAPARVRDRGEAKITYLEGELTWKARLGDTMQYAEAEGSDGRYSIEWTPEEVEFYWGQRLNRIEIARAFGLTSLPSGAGATGPKSGKSNRLSAAIVIGVVVIFLCLCIAMTALPSTGTSSGTFRGPSIRSGSPGRSFSGGGGSSGGGK